MEIIDAQIHELEPIKPWNAGSNPESALIVACEVAIAAMDAIGVDVALFNARPELCDFAISHYADRFGAYAVTNPSAPDLEGIFEKVRDTPGSVAVRAVLGNWKRSEAPAELRAGVFEPMFKVAEKYGVPIFCFIPGYPADLAPVAKAHPNLTLIVDHIGMIQQPMQPDRQPFERLPQLLMLSQFPNVAVKLCGAETLIREPYPYPSVWPYVHQIINAFGADRVMWASDFTRLRFKDGMTERAPRSSWYGLYSDSLGYLRDTNELSAGDKESILGGAARKVLKWPAGPASDASGSQRKQPAASGR